MIGHDVKFEESHFLFYYYFLTDINSTDILRTQGKAQPLMSYLESLTPRSHHIN